MTEEKNINPSDYAQNRGFSVELPDSYDTYVDRWAIMIGVSKYKHESLNLKYADRDAEAFYNLMLSPIGGNFKPDHIVKLINHEATTANVTKALRSFLKKPGREDLVIIYFACHGSPDFDRPGNVYLLTHDTDPNDIAGTALPMREIDLSLRENLLSERVVILADTCHSAAIGGGIGRRGTTNSTALVNRYLKEVSTTRGGIALLTSAEAAEVSFEDARWGGGHGVFTHYLLRGMQGEADLNQNGFVTIGELFEYVRAKVQEDTEYRQHPSIGTNPYDRELPLAITFPNNENTETSPNPIFTPRLDSIRTPITNPIPTPRLNSIPTPLLNKRILLSLGSAGGIIIVLLLSTSTLFSIVTQIVISILPPAQDTTISRPISRSVLEDITRLLSKNNRPPEFALSPTRTPSPVQTISEPTITPSTIIIYFPQQDAEAVKSALAPFAIEIGVSNKDTVPSTNAIWFGSEVSIEDVKLVAKKLLQANIPIKSIRPFNDPTSKPFVIEVGADRDLHPNTPVLTLEQINNAQEFKR